jgi:hypothetical protein
MARTVTSHVRKRGALGKIFKWAFVLFNIAMAVWFFGGLFSVGGQVANETNTARQVGGAIGVTLGLAMVLGIWLVGDLILGVLALATRGKIVSVEERVD